MWNDGWYRRIKGEDCPDGMKWIGVVASVWYLVSRMFGGVSDTPPVSPSTLEGEVTSKYVALTFDADMTEGMKKKLESGIVKSWINKEVIEYLENEKIPATIFVTGMWAELYPNELKEMASNGLFEIGNHSYDHPGFSQPCYTLRRVTEAEKKTEVEKTQKIVKEMAGNEPKLFRFPGGCASKKDRELVESFGLKVVDWDLSSTDAFNKSEENIANKVLSRVKDGDDIVFHLHGGPNAPKTAQALKIIVPALRERGFGFKRVSDLW